MFVRIAKVFVVLLVHMYVISSVAENIGQLPHCVEDTEHGLLIVSTLDGKVSALNSSGSLLWQVDTGTLLKSNIHNIELANNAEWIRLIPSLTGGLYKFNGKTIDAIPISADSLLKSSFFYSPDLIIAGGKEVKTYGIGLHSGHLFYTCSLLGCQNETNFDGEIDNVLIIERNTLTVRAHEPRTGNERWNFSVGHHNLKIPSVSCLNVDNKMINFNVTAILPEGLLVTTKLEDKSQILWQYKFDVPIVNVWLWNGRRLSVVDVFDVPVAQDTKLDISPAIYLAMHNKQLYIHESTRMLDIIQSNVHPQLDVRSNSKSITKIPWKPIPASSGAITKTGEQDVTALSVLYNSEYVNGNGYYLYADVDSDNKGDYICSDNTTKDNSSKDAANSIVASLQNNWAYAVLLLITAMTVYLVYDQKPFVLLVQKEKSQEQKLLLPSPAAVHNPIPEPLLDPIQKTYVSNYESTFETIGSLGRGGFGVVFEAKQKVDECSYAIKRITLPDSNAKDHVLREVKALATLDHRNIVRYYNSWFEKPPVGWKYQCDKKYADTESEEEEETEASSYSKVSHKRSNSTVIDMSIISEPVKPDNSTSDFDISFRNSTRSGVPDQTKSESENTEESSNSKLIVEKRNDAGKIYLYIQMQLCKPDSLQDWLFHNRCRTKSDIVPIFRQILNAVQYIHSKGLIHRDLKPNNIFFSLENDVKVGDFGLVATTNDNADDWGGNITSLQSHTKGVGTQLYMSPEQLEKKRYNLKVDIYSLGVILFELLVPFKTEMERRETLMNLRERKYPNGFQQSFPDEYRLLEKMLSHNPDVRPLTEQIKKTSPFTPTC